MCYLLEISTLTDYTLVIVSEIITVTIEVVIICIFYE